MDDRQSTSSWTILNQCPLMRRQVFQHLARNTKAIERLLYSQVLPNNHHKVTYICSVRNLCHDAQKGKFKLSCLDILNFFCLILLMFLSIHTVKFNFEYQEKLIDSPSLKICCKNCLWSHSLSTQQRSHVKCQSYYITASQDLSTDRSSEVYIKLEGVCVKFVES